MNITVRLPDGSQVETPTDDPKQAAAAARKYWEAQSAPKPKRSALQTAGDFVGDVVDNVLPNWGDEIAAIPDAASALLNGKPVGEAFDKGRKEFRDHQSQYDEEHPYLSWGSTLGGIGASLALPAGRVAEGASMGLRMAHGAAVGAGYGAVAGAGEGDTLSDRAKNAAYAGGHTAAFGGIAAPAMAGAMGLGRAVRQNVPGVDAAARTLANIPRAILRRPLVRQGQRAQEQGDRMLGNAMNEGHIQEGMGQPGAPASPDAIAGAMEQRQAMGVPAMPGEITEPMRNLTSWASRGMGPGQRRVRQSLDARKAQEATRVRGHIVDQFGPATDPIAQMETHMRQASERARPGYRAAYAQPMVVTPEIEGIMRTPAFQDALPQALRNIRNAQRNPTELGFRLDQQGNITGAQTLTTEGFDQVVRAMRETGQDAMRPPTFPGGRPTNTTNSIHINDRARDLRDHIGQQNEPYREVTTQYADDMAQREAFNNGRDISKLTGHEINAQGRAMPENAQGSWTIGARTALADQASDYGAKFPTGDTAANIRKSLGDETKQAAISEMTGNTGAVRGLQDRLEYEHQGNILHKEVQGNSKTADRQALDADLDEAAGARPLSSLTPRGMLERTINHIASAATTQFKNDVKARIAEIATETNPDTVRELMAAVADRAQRDRAFADLLHRSGVISAKAYANGVQPLAPEASDEPAPLEVSVWGGDKAPSPEELAYRNDLAAQIGGNDNN